MSIIVQKTDTFEEWRVKTNQIAAGNNFVNIEASGNITAVTFNSLSDATFKENITPISNSLDVISKLNGYDFDWKNSNKKASGLIAQEVEKVLPHLVDTNENGAKSINYDGVIAYMLNAINELRNK